MRFKVLKIHNIASIADATIDFTKSPLSDSPIFLICGETGSGKTTILDAICLALYNQTPRLNNNRASADTTYSADGEAVDIKDVRQLIKKGETEASVSLSFISSAGQVYLAEWSCRIKRTGTIDKVKWQVSDGASSPITEDVADKMEEIIGLSFSQFCRTSMLAQGQFTEFLKADNKSRSDILEKITGTEVYAEIGNEIHQRHLNASKAYEDLSRDVKKIELPSDEEKDAHKQTIETLEKEVNANAEVMKTLRSVLNAINAIEAAEHEKADAEKKYGDCKELFNKLSSGLLFEKAELQEKEAECKEIEAWLEARKSKAVIYTNFQTIVNELGNISTQRNAKDLKNAEKGKALIKQEEMSLAMKAVKEAEEAALTMLSGMDKELEQARKVKAGMNPDEVEKTRQSVDRVNKALAEAENAWAKIKAKKERLEEDQKKLEALGASIEKDRLALEGLKKEAEKTKLDFEAIDAVYQKQKESTDKLVVELRAKLREGLEENGEAVCPVCQRSITSLLTDQEVEDALKPVREHRDECETLFKNADKAYRDAADTLKVKLKDKDDKQLDYNSSKTALKTAEQEFVTRFGVMGFKEGDEDVEAKLESIKRKNEDKKTVNEADLKKISDQDKVIETLQTKRDTFSKESVEPATKKLNELKIAATKLEGFITICQVAVEAAETSESLSKEKLDKLFGSEAWEHEWEAGKDEFTSTLKNETEEYGKKLDRHDHGLTNELRIMRTSVKEHSDAMEGISKADPAIVNGAGAAVSFDGNATMAWGALKTGLDACRKQKEGSEATIAEQNTVLNGLYSQDATLPREKKEIEDRVQQLSDENFTKGQKVGAARSALEAAAELKAKKGKLEEELDEKEKVKAQWARLNKLFGGDGGINFRKIAQSYIMQDILNNANKYLSRIAGRYVLTAQPGSLLILVKDKEDGSVRSGNTLSGGEGFIVSLALALGLSSMGENNITVDTIFIDEGFGTLSAELLSSVMSTLEKLNSTSGKNVGIISHIEELQKKIPACIRVTKENATTSSISIS